ncbi:MAG: hypothetical protein ACXWNK_07325 [Vulcanimicrobiaceae bacterium]
MSDVQKPCKVPFTWPNIHTNTRSASANATLAIAFLSPDITTDVIPFQDEDGNVDYINSWEKAAVLARAVLRHIRELEARGDEEAAR